MTRPTTALIALGLLVASLSLAPSTQAAQLGCANALAQADRQAAPTADILELVQDCLGEPCPPGTSGAAGTCVNPRAVKACDDEGKTALEQCGIDTCPPGSVGVVLNGKATCIVPGVCGGGANLADCGIQNCPPGQVGIRVDGKGACKPVNGCAEGQVSLQDCGIATCPAPSKGVIVQGRHVCVDQAVPEAPEPDGPSCEETDDDDWPGGSDVRCRYDCPSGSLLAIYVKADDPDADANGSTACGDNRASCGEGVNAPTCSGLSKGVNAESGEHAACDGWTDEINSSPVTVMCWAIGPGTVVTPCNVYPPLCGMAVESNAALLDACVGQNLDLDDLAVAAVDRLLQQVPPEFTSLVAIELVTDSWTSVSLTSSGSGVACFVDTA